MVKGSAIVGVLWLFLFSLVPCSLDYVHTEPAGHSPLPVCLVVKKQIKKMYQKTFKFAVLYRTTFSLRLVTESNSPVGVFFCIT